MLVSRSFVRGVFVACLLLLPTALAFGGPGVEAEVVSDDGQHIVLRLRFEDYRSQDVIIEGQRYQLLTLPGEAVSTEEGSPALPLAARSVIVPGDARMAVHVVSAYYREVPARIAPSKGNLSRCVDPASVPYAFGPAYERDEFLPGPLATLSAPYIMRDFRGVAVRLHPFQYNPVKGLLRVYREMTISVDAAGEGRINVLPPDGRKRNIVAAFDTLYAEHFLNYSNHSPAAAGTDYVPMDEEGDMLIICHDPWLDQMSDFVSHKQGQGISTSLVGVSEIGNDAASIKSYIQDLYDSSDLAYVLLVGDAAEVATPQAHGGAADPTYAKLAGGDDYPDIMVGRFSAQTVEQLRTQASRTIDYEDQPATQQPWFKRASGIASDQGAGQGDENQSDKEHMGEIRGWLMGDGYDPVDEIYDPGATDDDVRDAVNAGRGLINYCGHGSATSWGTTGFNNADVDALVNDSMLPFIFSVACNNGEFDHYDTCYGEAWLRATDDTTGEPTGAVAMYASSISQSWAPPMEAQDEFNLRLTDSSRPYHSFGGLCFAGSSSMIDAYGSGGVEMFDTWIIFGDPSVRVYGTAGPPTGLEVTPGNGLEAEGPAGGPLSPDSLDYTLINHNETSLDYEVTADAWWVSVTDPVGSIEGGGTASVTVFLGDGARNLDNGAHETLVHFVNTTDHDGDTTRPVTARVGQRLAVESFDLEQDPGWGLEGEWQFGTPTGEGGGAILNPDPTSGATGSHVYGTNLTGNIAPVAGGPYYLTAGPFDLSQMTQVRLDFQRWLNLAGPPYAAANVQTSADGVEWSDVWVMNETVTDGAWTPQTFDLSGVLDRSAAAYVRWGYGVQHSISLLGSGWNIDDIELTAVSGSTARIELTLASDALDWSDVAGAESYDVVRGDLASLVESGGDFSAATEDCLADDYEGTHLDDPDHPAAGEGYWYLVRGVSSTGPMTYQSLSASQQGVRDEEIAAAAGSCP